MNNSVLRRLLVVSVILGSTAIAGAEPITKPADAPAQTREEQTHWVAKKDTVKSFKGKKVLIRMIVQANTLEMVLTGTVSYEKRTVLSPPARLEIDIPHAANALGADMIDINKIGIAKVLFVNNDDFLRVIVVPTEGTPLPSRIEATHNSRGLLINMAARPTEPYSVPVTDKPAIPAASALPTETVTPSTPAVKSTPSPLPVTTGILSDKVAPVATPRAKSHERIFLVVGESVNRKKLDAVVKKVRAAGVKPDVTAATKQVEVFRLLVASYAETKPAELRRAQVARHTKNAFIARDGDSYCVCAGSLMSEESARREQKRLAAKGLEGLQIVRVLVPLKVWRVTAGCDADVRQALKLHQALTKRGIKVSSSEMRVVETGT
ncbi:AMIN domain-containing protein [Geobacter sp. AOG1]|uniref:AMIN domain-containing protein n=1 Tax=Geobacter sp. AOG1 TaxID=1566346 RepID=UPI001CC5990A|nr:AMIN domain-containing protein [Geobacter sp. AOG1]GFE58084.1 hypothetical protein AOG1_19640 [Geobacter sp. AOG1]